MNTKKIALTLKMIISLLAQRDYEKLYTLDKEKYLAIEDIREFIDDYGGEITLPKNNEWHYDFYSIDGSNDVAIDLQLYVDNKLSYLTLQCRLSEDYQQDYYPFCIQSIHIL